MSYLYFALPALHFAMRGTIGRKSDHPSLNMRFFTLGEGSKYSNGVELSSYWQEFWKNNTRFLKVSIQGI